MKSFMDEKLFNGDENVLILFSNSSGEMVRSQHFGDLAIRKKKNKH